MSWETICKLDDIPLNAGMAALVNGHQIAIYRFGDELYALDNYCPFAKANVLSRGILGSLQEKLVVASPIYKQHYGLTDGVCLEDSSVQIGSYPVRLNGDTIELDTLALQAAA